MDCLRRIVVGGLLGIAVVTALSAPASARPYAPEGPEDTIELPNGQRLILVCSFNQEDHIQVFGSGSGSASGIFEASVYLDKHGNPLSCHLRIGASEWPYGKFILFDRNRRQVKIASSDQCDWEDYSEKPTTLCILARYAGRLYDFAAGGAQTLQCLIDGGMETPHFAFLTLTADGWETIDVSGRPTEVRRLRYSTRFSYLDTTDRSGVLYLGDRGEVLRCDTRLFGDPIVAGVLAFTERIFPDNTRRITLAAGIGSKSLVSTATITADCQPLAATSAWDGRPYTAVFNPARAILSVAPDKPGEYRLPDERVWLGTQWLTPDVWEDQGPFAHMEVGQYQTGTYFPVFTGEPEGTPFLLTRLPDVVAWNFGTSVQAHHYQMTSAAMYDYYTDGYGGFLLIGSNGLKIYSDKFTVGPTRPHP